VLKIQDSYKAGVRKHDARVEEISRLIEGQNE
jgi:hypothetical protein